MGSYKKPINKDPDGETFRQGLFVVYMLKTKLQYDNLGIEKNFIMRDCPCDPLKAVKYRGQANAFAVAFLWKACRQTLPLLQGNSQSTTSPSPLPPEWPQFDY